MTTSTATLAGRRILLTRSADDCADWADVIERRGARPVLLPCIRTEDLDSPQLRRALAAAVESADWLVLTSRRGVAAFAALRATAMDGGSAANAGAVSRPPGTPAVPNGCRVAVVGTATAAAARERLGRADLVGHGTAADLAAALAAELTLAARPRVLIAVAENAGDVLESKLAAAGARCTRLDVYRTVPAPEAARKRALSSLGADNVVLASPSAASGFVHQVEIDAPVHIYTIGPSTTAAARALGLTITAEAREPSLEGVLEAMQWRN